MNDDFKTNVRRWAFERMMYGTHNDTAKGVLQPANEGGASGRIEGEEHQPRNDPGATVARVVRRKRDDYKSGSRLPSAKFSFLRN